MPDEEAQVTVAFLQEFADAWNRHDIDALMSFMTEDCVFEASAGLEVSGTSFVGADDVRAGFSEVWITYPDAHWGNARHFVHGGRGVSEWTFTGTRADGRRLEVHGCDLFTFRDGKIAIKNSYRKNRPPLSPPRSMLAVDTLWDFATRYTAAWCAHDPDGVAAHYAPDGSLTINDGEPAVGRAAIAAAAQGFMTAFPDLVVIMEDLVEQGDRVVYHWTLEGTNTGVGGTGNRVRIGGSETWLIGGDGLVAESGGAYDAADYARQLAGEA